MILCLMSVFRASMVGATGSLEDQLDALKVGLFIDWRRYFNVMF